MMLEFISIMNHSNMYQQPSIFVFMLIGTNESIAKMDDVRIHINNEPLKHVRAAKYLRIYRLKSQMGRPHMIPNI